MKDFLNTLAERSGIGTGEDNISDLRNWGVKIEEDELDRSFDYTDLSEKLAQLIDEGDDLESLKNKHIIDRNASMSPWTSPINQMSRPAIDAASPTTWTSSPFPNS